MFVSFSFFKVGWFELICAAVVSTYIFFSIMQIDFICIPVTLLMGMQI